MHAVSHGCLYLFTLAKDRRNSHFNVSKIILIDWFTYRHSDTDAYLHTYSAYLFPASIPWSFRHSHCCHNQQLMLAEDEIENRIQVYNLSLLNALLLTKAWLKVFKSNLKMNIQIKNEIMSKPVTTPQFFKPRLWAQYYPSSCLIFLSDGMTCSQTKLGFCSLSSWHPKHLSSDLVLLNVLQRRWHVSRWSRFQCLSQALQEVLMKSTIWPNFHMIRHFFFLIFFGAGKERRTNKNKNLIS